MRRSLISCLASITLLAAVGCGAEAGPPTPPSTSVATTTESPTAPPPTAAAPSEPTPSEPAGEPTPSVPTPGAATDEPTSGLGSTDAPQLACSVDEDCMVAPASSCCPPCCDCPTVMSRASWEQMQRVCAVADCMGHDCRAVRCMACPPITAARCIEGRCTGT